MPGREGSPGQPTRLTPLTGVRAPRCQSREGASRPGGNPTPAFTLTDPPASLSSSSSDPLLPWPGPLPLAATESKPEKKSGPITVLPKPTAAAITLKKKKNPKAPHCLGCPPLQPHLPPPPHHSPHPAMLASKLLFRCTQPTPIMGPSHIQIPLLRSPFLHGWLPPIPSLTTLLWSHCNTPPHCCPPNYLHPFNGPWNHLVDFPAAYLCSVSCLGGGGVSALLAGTQPHDPQLTPST